MKTPIADLLNPERRSFLKTAAAGAALAGGGLLELEDARAHAYAPYLTDNQLTAVVTSCDHNCGSRHMLVAHKKGDVIVRLSTDDGRYQAGGAYGKDTPGEPQLRACLRGRSYRTRIYSPERLLAPMLRVGERGEGKFKRVSWDEALDHIAHKMVWLKRKYGPTAILDQAYAGASFGVLHKSDQIEGLLARFLGMFGCRTSSWSVPSYQGTTFSSRITFGTITDGNEDDAFAHSKLIVMWGWNPAYTFHGGNTCYYMRLAKQRGCTFVVVDPQYTDSAAAYDAWWIPIRPNTDAAMLAGMAHHIFANHLQDQPFIDRFVQGMDAGTMPGWATGQESFKDYILGMSDRTPKTPEWAERICGVAAADIRKLADLYARTKPAALKASWAPGRAAHGEQYSRMAAALQAMTGNIGVLGGCAEGVGKGWHPVSVAHPHDENANLWWASIKSDRWAHCVLNYPDVKREEIGCWPRNDALDGQIPNIRAIFWHGSDWFNQLTNINKGIEAIKKLELVVCSDSTITPSALWADVLLPAATHFERHDVGLPWYKGHYYIHRPKVIAPLGEAKTDFQIYTELAYRLEALDPGLKDFGKRYNPRAGRDYFQSPDAVDEAYLAAWWKKVQDQQGVKMSWEEFKRRGVYKFIFDQPLVAFRAQIEKGEKFETPSGKIEIFSTTLARVADWTRTQYGAPIPAIPKWIEPFEWIGHGKAGKYPFHLVTPHPRWRTHSMFHNLPWLRETYQQEVTINAADARRLKIETGDIVEVWNGRGRIVVPAYVTERCMPGVAVVHEGAWMDLDKRGTDRAGNPDFLTKDEPSPAGAFAYNTVLVNLKKTALEHHPGWDVRATSRSIIFRRDA
ncbi:MAG: molybdopterin-dependent oxidoreductase [Betaproteobacteria bacterium]|nr:molybdopterin-dependent oxidoreductase [Betaproteobacteria bacterium]